MTKVPVTRPLDLGLHYVSVPCPSCSVVETFAVELGSALVLTSEHTATLRLTAKSKAERKHSCGQLTVDGELADDDESDVPALVPAADFVGPGSRA